jgi:hypothetical protein
LPGQRTQLRHTTGSVDGGTESRGGGVWKETVFSDSDRIVIAATDRVLVAAYDAHGRWHGCLLLVGQKI